MSSTGPQMFVPWGTTLSGQVEHFVRTGTSTGPWTRYTTSRIRKVKLRFENGKAALQNGWRPPTVYRMFAATVHSDGVAFSYEGENVSRFPVAHRGPEAYLPSSSLIYVGTQGAGRYPIQCGARERAITECLLKLQDSDVNLSESAASMGQTLNMLHSSTKGLLDSLKAAMDLLKGRPVAVVQQVLRLSGSKRGRKKLRRLLGKATANRWLEYQYGWKPLMSDISYLMNTAREGVDKPPLRISAIRNVQYSLGVSAPPPKMAGALSSVSGRIRSGAKCRLDADLIWPTLYQLNQVGVLNPLLLTWELIPFSFVIDWLLPIGNFIQAMTGNFGFGFRGGSVTSYTLADVKYTWTEFKFLKGTPIRANVESMAMWREIFGSLPIPRPYMKNPFSLTRTATTLALLSQLDKRRL